MMGQKSSAAGSRCVVPTLAAALSLFAPRSAWACTRCADAALDFVFPWNWPVAVVLLLWLVVGALFWKTLSGLTPADVAEPGRANPNALITFGAAFGVAFTVGIFNIMPSSMLMLPVTLGWLGYLIVVLARSLRRKSWPPATRLFHRMNLGALLLSIMAGGAGWIAARQPEAAVNTLAITPHSQVAIPYILKVKEQAVPALATGIHRGFRLSEEPIQPYYIVPYAWCLSRIGTPAASEPLKELLKTHATGSLHGDGRWQLGAACVYAEGFGASAVPALRELYDRETDSGLRLVALTALARTGSREGVLLAVDHLAELVVEPFGSDATIHPLTAAVAETVARMLAATRDPDLLRTSNLFGSGSTRLMQFGMPVDPNGKQFPEMPRAAVEAGLIERIQSMSPEENGRLRAEWEAVFEPAGS